MSVMNGVTHTEVVDKRCRVRGVGLSKTFGRVKALQDADIEINCGEVLALVEDNGAGKTTLIKILCGDYQPDKGQIEIDGHFERPEGYDRAIWGQGIPLGHVGFPHDVARTVIF